MSADQIPDDIREVIDAYDCQIISDIAENSAGKTVGVYSLGWPPEPAAGLRSGYLTDWHPTLDDLFSDIRKRRPELLRNADIGL